MAGAVAIVIALLVLPVLMAMGGAVLSAALGWSLHRTVADEHADSELVDLNT